MRYSIPRLSCLLVLVMVCTAPFCSAATVRIEFTGLNLEYNGTDIFDSDPLTNPAVPDQLTSVAITVDNIILRQNRFVIGSLDIP